MFKTLLRRYSQQVKFEFNGSGALIGTAGRALVTHLLAGVDSSEPIILQGMKGTGKTTIAKGFCEFLPQMRKDVMPVYVDAGVEHAINLPALMARKAAQLGISLELDRLTSLKQVLKELKTKNTRPFMIVDHIDSFGADGAEGWCNQQQLKELFGTPEVSTVLIADTGVLKPRNVVLPLGIPASSLGLLDEPIAEWHTFLLAQQVKQNRTDEVLQCTGTNLATVLSFLQTRKPWDLVTLAKEELHFLSELYTRLQTCTPLELKKLDHYLHHWTVPRLEVRRLIQVHQGYVYPVSQFLLANADALRDPGRLYTGLEIVHEHCVVKG